MKFSRGGVVGITLNPQPGGPGYSVGVLSSSQCPSFKAPGTRLHLLSSATSNDALPRGCHLEVRVEFVSIADLMTLISWLFSGFIRHAYLASTSLSEANTNLYPQKEITGKYK
jgi:hypothetical protein